MIVRLVSCALALMLTVGAARAAEPASIVNPGFEAPTPEQPLAGWSALGEGYAGERSLERPASGQASGRLAYAGTTPAGGAKFGTISQRVAAAPYRGRLIRLRAMVRTSGQAGLWMRIDDAAKTPLFLDNMSDRRITAADWTPAEILANVPAGAETIFLGLILTGAGEAFVDDVRIDDLGPAAFGLEAPRPLAGRGADNLAAFARAFGYVRYFYPGETAVGADWPSLALAGAQRIEAATSPKDLAQRLEAALRPLAPDFRAWPTAGAPPKADAVATGPGLRWRHQGVGVGSSRLYSSTRIAAQAGDPADLFTAALPGGVSVRLPLVVATGAPPTAPPSPPRPDKPKGFQPSGDDRATRLADVIIAWNVFQHFYPYFDVVAVDWKAELGQALGEAATAPDATAFTDVLARMVAALQDGHGGVGGPGPPRGFPPVAWEWIEDRLVVLAAPPGSGLAVGDVVTKLDGQAVADRQAARETLISSATPQWKRWKASQTLGIGTVGSKVTIEGVHADGSPVQVTLERAAGSAPAPTKPAMLSDLEPGVVYVDLARIGEDELKAALPRLAPAQGVVFDLRGYPGKLGPRSLTHFSDKVVHSADWNVPVSLRPDHQGVTWKTSRWIIEPEAPRLTGKLVFITDGRAISRAESFLSVIEGERLAFIVGEPTAGTNGDINPFTLPGGYSITWTGLKVTKSDGSPHHGVGIKPTHTVHRTLAGVRAGRDEQLEAALALVRPTAP